MLRTEENADHHFLAGRAEWRPDPPRSTAQSGGYRRSGSRGRGCWRPCAIRALCPETPISLTTSASIVRNPEERFSLVEAWEDMPDLVTANQGEPGIAELCELLLLRGVAIEAGLLRLEDARAFVRSGLAGRCRRVLIEPLDADPDAAVQHAATMEDIVVSSGITLEQVHHGYGMACWAVNRRGLDRGHGIRTGLEDITLLPDGTQARDNADLVAAAVRLIRAYVRPSPL